MFKSFPVIEVSKMKYEKSSPNVCSSVELTLNSLNGILFFIKAFLRAFFWAFLTFSKSKGNDLTRAYPEYNFPGLVAGDHWCLCVSRWLEAYRSDVAPQVILKACHKKTLDYVSLHVLKKFAFDPA